MAAIVQINTSHIKNFQKKDQILGLSAKKVELLLTKTDKSDATELRGFSWLNNSFWSIFGSKSTLKLALEAIHDQIHSPDEEKTPPKTLLKLHEISKLTDTHEDQINFLESVVFTSSTINNNEGLFQSSDNLADYEINIAGHHFSGVFLKANQQQIDTILQANGSLKPKVIDTLSSSVSISHDDIIADIQTIFGEHPFFLSDSYSVNNQNSLIQDRAWSLRYGAQSFYKPSGDSDFKRHGDISEQQLLSLNDLEKIQLFQLRGIMAGALNAIRMIITQDENITDDQRIKFLQDLTKGNYVEFHREFSKQYLSSKKIELKGIALEQLKVIATNLLNLKVKLKTRGEQLKLHNFTVESLERQIEIKEKAIDKLSGQKSQLETLQRKKALSQKNLSTLNQIKKKIKQKEAELIKLKDKLSEFKIPAITILGCGIKSDIKDSMLQSEVESRILSVLASIRRLQQTEDYPISENVFSLFSKMED